MGLLFFLIIPVAMYFLMIRPQRKRQRQQAELQAFITGEEDDKFWLEIDENVQIRIAKAAIQGRVGDTAAPAVESGSPSKEPIDATSGDDADDTDSK